MLIGPVNSFQGFVIRAPNKEALIEPVPKRVIARPNSSHKGLVIEIVGAFNMDIRREFQAAYEGQSDKYQRYAINLKNCTSLDSTGLGLLLVMRDYIGLSKEEILIIHCSPPVRQVLDYANFGELFKIYP